MSVHASLGPGNTHAFREAHPQCSLLLRNRQTETCRLGYTPIWLRIGSCLLVIESSREHFGFQFTFAYPAGWLAGGVRSDLLLLVPFRDLSSFV